MRIGSNSPRKGVTFRSGTFSLLHNHEQPDRQEAELCELKRLTFLTPAAFRYEPARSFPQALPPAAGSRVKSSGSDPNASSLDRAAFCGGRAENILPRLLTRRNQTLAADLFTNQPEAPEQFAPPRRARAPSRWEAARSPPPWHGLPPHNARRCGPDWPSWEHRSRGCCPPQS